MIVARRSVMALAFSSVAVAMTSACATKSSELDRDAEAALQRLYESNPDARTVSGRALAVLVFPRIVKAGLLAGAQTGNGVLLIGGKPAGYYNISAVSYGLQAGGQAFSYALFFMTDSALNYLKRTHGWAVGSGPGVVVVNRGAAASLTTTTMKQDVYAFPFGASGLMAGIGIEGSKITEINPS
jgi:lipid-binding SYLF domain-containing protein